MWKTEELPSSTTRKSKLPVLFQDKAWREHYLRDLEKVLRVLGCPAGAVATKTGPFGRLAGLSKLGAKEAASRSVIDKLLYPLCAELDVHVTVEEWLRNSPIPVSICDYVLRSGKHGQVLGALEAKRCSDGQQLLAQGVTQCILQLLACWTDKRPQPPKSNQPSGTYLVKHPSDTFSVRPRARYKER